MSTTKNEVLVGKVEAINSCGNMLNLVISVKNVKEKLNIKCLNQKAVFELNRLYEFNVYRETTKEREHIVVDSYKEVSKVEEIEEKDRLLREYYDSSNMDLNTLKSRIDYYISNIDNNILKTIVEEIMDDYNDRFYIYPAATKVHHAYVGGLAYHTVGILDLVDGFLKNYPYLDKNYLYAGAILHDVAKTIEFSGVEETSYTVPGTLLGHIVIGNDIVMEYAHKHEGFASSEEVMVLCHMLLSHHGIPNFGAARKPQTPEALLLWYLDTLDSKFRALGDHLKFVKEGEYTDSLTVLERQKFYRPHATSDKLKK